MSNSNQDSELAQSPFAIPHEDVAALHADAGFNLLRSHLACDATFCADHAACDIQAKETWILHRDLLHALVMPVLALFQRAATLASAALCTDKSAELELAFSGEARGAFLCLQCFVDEEEDWCRTRGCPACITTATLSTESHLRLTIAASLLSTTTATTPHQNATSLALPPLPHILPALRHALAQDPFWGPDTWPYLESRAMQLSAGIQGLMSQCVDLESLVSSPVVERSTMQQYAPRLLQVQVGAAGASEADEVSAGVRLRKSKLAKRQLRMKNEETQLMRRVAMQCWARARMPELAREMIGGGRERRVRSLTCP